MPNPLKMLCTMNYLMLLLFCFKQIFDAANRTKEVSGLVWQVDGLCLISLCKLLHHLDVLLGQQIICRIGTLTNSLGDKFDSLSFGLSLTDTSLCLTFGLQDGLLLSSLSLIYDSCTLTLRCKNLGSLLTLGSKDLGTLVTLGLHLLLHSSKN